MKFRYIKSILSAASLLLAVSVTSCIGDLDATPIDPNIVMTFDQASVFNKIYQTNRYDRTKDTHCVGYGKDWKAFNAVCHSGNYRHDGVFSL